MAQLKDLVQTGDIFIMEPSELAWPVLMELKGRSQNSVEQTVNIRDYVSSVQAG